MERKEKPLYLASNDQSDVIINFFSFLLTKKNNIQAYSSW